MEVIDSENSANIRQKPRLLTKISLSENEKADCSKSKHLCDILLLNNLTLFNKDKIIKQDLFLAISDSLYYTDKYANRLKNECKSF